MESIHRAILVFAGAVVVFAAAVVYSSGLVSSKPGAQDSALGAALLLAVVGLALMYFGQPWKRPPANPPTRDQPGI
jgi:NADH:ubiquinone oxidoreductase subunit 6 (subunit J)